MSQTLDFTTTDGESVSINAVINTAQEPLPFDAKPPLTTSTPVLAKFLPGYNVHGSLDLDFYASTDNPDDPSRLIIWAGGDGSQEENGIARLEPVAWIDFGKQSNGEDAYHYREDPSMLAALLAATIKDWVDAGWFDLDTELAEGDVLDQETLDRAWSDAFESEED